MSAKQIDGLAPGSVSAILIESLCGALIGLPTGPVVATGKLTVV